MMKTRTILSGIMAAAVIALSGCERFETAPVTEGVPFTIGAANAELKTVNDGVMTKWAKNDAINVFHAVAGTTTYVNDGKFIASADGSTVDFEGSLASALETSSTYDWYAFYPYTSQIETPANTSKGYATVGSSASGVQVQKASDSRAHVAGKNFPVVGVAAGVPSSDKPEIVMKNVATLMKVVVTNATTSAINVSGIALTAEDNLVGSYYIDFTDPDNIGFVGSGASYVSKTATLSVDDGAGAIAAGGTGNFYLAVKPFTAAAGSELKISVTAENGPQEITKEVTSAVEFKSGKVNTLNVTYNKTTSSNVYELVSSVDDLTLGSEVILVNASGNAAAGKLGTGTYLPSVAVSVSGGTKVNDPSDNVEVFKIANGNIAGTYALQCTSASDKYLTWSTGTTLTTSATLSNNGSWAIYMDAAGKTEIRSMGDYARYLRYNSSTPRITSYQVTTANTEDVYIYKKASTGSGAIASKTLTELSVQGLTTSYIKGATYSFDGTVVATYSDLSEEDVTASATVTGTVNTAVSGTYTITVSYGGRSVDVEILVSGSATQTYEMTIDGNSSSGTNDVHWTKLNTTLTHDSISWTTTVAGTTYINTSNTTYVQIGKKAEPATSVVISTTGFAGKKIVSASLTGYCMSYTGPTLTIKAGSTTMLNAKALVKTTSTEYETTTNNVTLGSSDALTFTITSSASAGIAISKITVNYTDAD